MLRSSATVAHARFRLFGAPAARGAGRSAADAGCGGGSRVRGRRRRHVGARNAARGGGEPAGVQRDQVRQRSPPFTSHELRAATGVRTGGDCGVDLGAQSVRAAGARFSRKL